MGVTLKNAQFLNVGNVCNNVQILLPNANMDETQYFDGMLLSDFLISNDVLGGTL